MNISESHLRLVVLGLSLVTSGCAICDSHRILICDEHAKFIQQIVVVPLYAESRGIGVGPEGVGPRSQVKYTLKKPYKISSGEDLLAQQIPTRGLICCLPLPPWVVFMGTSHEVEAWLFLKKHHAPRAFTRIDVFGDAPLILPNVKGDECRAMIDEILENKTAKPPLPEWFHVYEPITIDLDDVARALLEGER